MQTTLPAPRPSLLTSVWRSLFWRSPKLNNMTGVENALRILILLLFAAFFVMPLVWLLVAPTRIWQDMYDLTQSPLQIGPLSNYVVAWNNIALFGKGLLVRWTVNSVWYTLASVVLSVAVSIPTGYVLATMQFRGRQLVMWLTLITMILPASAMVLPLFLEMNLFRLIDNPWSVILPAAFAPFGVYLSYVYYSVTIPKDLLAAGKVDGANEWQLFWYIGLPLGRTMIATLAFLTFNGAWNNYFLPFVMLNHKELYNLPLGIAALMNSGAGSPSFMRDYPINEPEKALGGLVMIIPVMIIFLVAQKYIVKGLAAGAVKE
jgi:multiple sugar transport system permease protein